MQIEVNEKGIIVLKEVYSGIILETAEGVQFGICMRDQGIEVTVNKNQENATVTVVKLEK